MKITNKSFNYNLKIKSYWNIFKIYNNKAKKKISILIHYS
jgi:hypothetical protein